MFQGLMGRTTCTSELPSKNAKARFISVGIVTRWWIMHTRKVVGIVFCCEVWHLLQNVCLCNGCFNFAFIFTFSSKNLLTSLNWIAPTALHRPPFVLHTGGAESYAASDWRSRVEKSSPTYRATHAPFFPFMQPRYEITPWHIAGGRNCSTPLAPTRHAQGHSLKPSLEEAAQSRCGSHDSSSHWLAECLSWLPSSDSLHTHQGTLASWSIQVLPSFGPFFKTKLALGLL